MNAVSGPPCGMVAGAAIFGAASIRRAFDHLIAR
jgi:hypothetical protein